jgi:O-6-methylguanine DNA methyltransferase
LAHYSKSGLARLDFPESKMGKDTPLASPSLRRWHKLTCRAVDRVLHGQPIGEMPPLDLALGTPFQRKVWEALGRIETGKTETYARVAASLGRPKSARAVGGACGANPIPLLIPCHRVVATGGGVGGFSGGLHWKHKLLSMENGAAQS